MYIEPMDSTDPQISHSTGHFGASCLLFLSAFAFDIAQQLTLETTYIWIFRGFSILSLGLIIYINWNRALDIFKSRKKKTK